MIVQAMCAMALSSLAQPGVAVHPDDAYLSWGGQTAEVETRGFVSGSPSADLNGDGVIDFNDVLFLLNCFQNGLPCADFNGDGVINFSDILAWLNA